ncbi:competence protein CoiA [Latilactobacillus curvatus]|uniref:competence protein CoiA n=1 Tax=Latilactobacillus curvatus TaxID=28038 RepID=UPI0009778A2E|nr:competence protein CoiA family protein [Latilactobacillus curvatus]
MMKVAQTTNGCLIRADQAAKQQQVARYFCPHCQQLVQLHRGVHKAPYFAHIAERVSGGGESPAHLAGKQAIAELAHALGWHATFEVPVGETQRADVWLTRNQQPLIIEYQCSPLTPDKLNQRTIGYQQRRLPVLWVVGERYCFTNHYLSQQQLGFINYRRQWGFYVVSYLPKWGQWVLYHHIVARDFAGYAWQTLRLTTKAFVRLLVAQTRLPANHYKGKSQPMQQQIIDRRLGLQDAHYVALQADCYAHHERLQVVPDWCYCTRNVPPIYQLRQFESRVTWWLSAQPIDHFLTITPLLQQPLLKQSLFAQWGQIALKQALKKNRGSVDHRF